MQVIYDVIVNSGMHCILKIYPALYLGGEIIPTKSNLTNSDLFHIKIAAKLTSGFVKAPRWGRCLKKLFLFENEIYERILGLTHYIRLSFFLSFFILFF